MKDFVKASTTTVSVERSQAEVIATLGRYGASGFGFRRVGETVEVTFHLPAAEGPDRTVTVPVDIPTVHQKLQAMTARRVQRGSHVRRLVAREQAERVAWRVLLDWIEAALLAVALGVQTIEEAFFAHTVVTTRDGQTGRLIDYVHAIEHSTGDLPATGRPMLQLASGGRDGGGGEGSAALASRLKP